MAEFIGRAISNASNITRLRMAFDNKIDSLHEEARQGYEIPSSIFTEELYNEMLGTIVGSDPLDTQKWLLALSFVIKVELLRQHNGGKVPENASQFFEGLITSMLEALEHKSPMVVTDIFRSLKEVFEFILDPAVSIIVKCHKRLANRAFTVITQMPNTEEAEHVILVILTWMCATRTFSSEKPEDATSIHQLELLQNSSNDVISREATSLLMSNLKKLAKKEAKAVTNFISSNVNQIAQELELGVSNKISRKLELLKVAFEQSKQGDAGATVGLSHIFRIFTPIFDKMSEYDIKTIDSASTLLVALCKFIGPDLLLVNLPSISIIFNAIFGNTVETISARADMIEELLKEMNDLCSDFYLVLKSHFQSLLDAIQVNVNKDQGAYISKLITVVTQMCGISVAHKIEALILSMISNEAISWTNVKFSDAVVHLIQMNIRKGCSNHPLVLNTVLLFLRRLRGITGHNKLMDDTMQEVRSIICDAKKVEPDGSYNMYIEELQRFMEKSEKRSLDQTKAVDAPMPDTEPDSAPAKTKQEDVVDAIRKKLKAMRKTTVA